MEILKYESVSQNTLITISHIYKTRLTHCYLHAPFHISVFDEMKGPKAHAAEKKKESGHCVIMGARRFQVATSA